MALSLDGRWLVTTGVPPDSSDPGGHTALWKARTLEQVGHPFAVGGNDVALSPNGRTAAIAAAESGDGFGDSLKGRLVLLDLRTGGERKSRTAHARTLGSVVGLTGVTFSADGRSVISTGDDDRVLVWDASGSSVPTIHEAFDDPAGLFVRTPALSPDGATAYTIDVDGDIVVWDLKGTQRLGRTSAAGPGGKLSFPAFAISPDGGTLAIVQQPSPQHGLVLLADSSTVKILHVIPYSPSGAAAFSPDNQTLAVVANHGYVGLWDYHTGRPTGPPFRVPVPGADRIDFWAAAFNHDGSVLATAGSQGSHGVGVVFLWNAATGQLIGQLPRQKQTVNAVNFSPDGTLLVASAGISAHGHAIVWNVSESRVVRSIPVDDSGVWTADISNDGTTLVTGGQSSGERFWNLSTGEQDGPAFLGPPANTVDLSPDGRTLVVAGQDQAGQGQIIMWDIASGSILGQSWVPGSGSSDQFAAAFSPDGSRLFIVSITGKVWVWDVDPASWEARACQIAGRSLTEAEWQVNLPDRPYAPTCGS
jgi:WD40 repeat protein